MFQLQDRNAPDWPHCKPPIARMPRLGYDTSMSHSSSAWTGASKYHFQERWEAVATVRSRELASMTEAQALRIIFSLKPFAPFPADPKNGMGLVEQQAIFHRRRA
jgi:hypothetical protein